MTLASHSQSTTDLEYEILYDPSFVPIRKSRVSVKTVVEGGKKRRIMRNHTTGAYYELDQPTYFLWTLIDGRRNVDDIVNAAEKSKVQQIYETLLFFAESGSLDSKKLEQHEGRIRVISPFKIEMPIIRHSQGFLRKIHRGIEPILRTPALWISLGFIIVTGIFFAGTFETVFANRSNFSLAGSVVVGFFFYQFIILTPICAIHEIAHGVALTHYGGRPGEIGTGIYYFGNIFYCDTVDSWTLTRGKRIMVMLAGNISTFLVGAILVAITYLIPLAPFAAQVVTVTAFWCYYVALWNFAPPFETDGYYVITDLVNMPTLKADAYEYLAGLFKRLLRRPPTNIQVDRRKKTIYISYVIFSVTFLGYIVFATLRFAYFMAQDSAYFLLRLFTGLNPTQLIVALVSIFYFVLSVSGYGAMFVTAARKAAVRSLKIESIHDRNLAVIAYLPPDTPISLTQDLRSHMRALGRKFAGNIAVAPSKSLQILVLRMGSAKLALQQIRRQLRNTELAFNAMYQTFLFKNRKTIQESVGIYSPHKVRLTRLLKEMGDEISRGGVTEARRIVNQLIERQLRTTEYLLLSISSTIWAVELPPALLLEFQESILPSALAEDLSVTDLYGDVEEFKKRMIYGYDSLNVFSGEIRANLKQAMQSPESFHIISSFEPVKSRLLFIGRTESVEKEIVSFGALFVVQVWSGFLDNLLCEINLALSVAGEKNVVSKTEMESAKDGEITVLRKNLNELAQTRALLEGFLKEARQLHIVARENMQEISRRIEVLGTPGLELLQPIFSFNAENLDSLPERFDDLEILIGGIFRTIDKMNKSVETEYLKRVGAFSRRQRRLQHLYVFYLGGSILLGALGAAILPTFFGWILLGLSLTLQAMFVGIYILSVRSFQKVGRFPSTFFERVELYLFTIVQAFFNLTSTADLLKPSRTSSSDSVKATSHGEFKENGKRGKDEA